MRRLYNCDTCKALKGSGGSRSGLGACAPHTASQRGWRPCIPSGDRAELCVVQVTRVSQNFYIQLNLGVGVEIF
jgi:hypothetical protein